MFGIPKDIGKTAWGVAKSAFNEFRPTKAGAVLGAGIGEMLGAAYGATSDDTSVLGGAAFGLAIGAGLGAAIGHGYSRAMRPLPIKRIPVPTPVKTGPKMASNKPILEVMPQDIISSTTLNWSHPALKSYTGGGSAGIARKVGTQTNTMSARAASTPVSSFYGSVGPTMRHIRNRAAGFNRRGGAPSPFRGSIPTPVGRSYGTFAWSGMRKTGRRWKNPGYGIGHQFPPPFLKV